MKSQVTSKSTLCAFRLIADRILLDEQDLDAVTGGGPRMLASSFSNAVKAIGQGLATLAQKG